ncbi:class I SAM-dependent rRNA methyltransferase [Desulfuromonas acetoxidans]|uniref:class I SAM-dependent rRNA methyltransferase n=1 Tax=Desulfuromonas acetoxidans TaxID=891 RepID=UPI00292EF524|nr:class I SAM-dependent rRNA methyltransferase [Desulfuromonas acetoxidans]
MKRQQRKSCVIGPQTEQMLKLGHPWVIEDRFTRKWPTLKCGELVTLTSEQGKVLAIALVDPGQRIVARVLGDAGMMLNGEWFRQKIHRAEQRRRDHAGLDGTNAYRVINGEGDGLPGLTVERYDGYLMIQLYSRSWEPHLNMLVQALQQEFQPDGIYEKFRPQKTRELEKKGSKRFSRLLAGSAVPDRYTVEENHLTYRVSLEEGLNTGLFMDQRANRCDLAERCQGKRVLNLFCYTGAFSVAAAASGATRVTSVDASPHYLDQARENFGLNRINAKRHAFICGDCFDVLPDLLAQGERFDIVIMDPPSFSTTTKNRFTTQGGTAKLVAQAMALLEDGGLLITSSNHQKVDLADYLKELRRGALEAGSDLTVLKTAGQAEDFPYPVTFPEGRYLKYVMAVKG